MRELYHQASKDCSEGHRAPWNNSSAARLDLARVFDRFGFTEIGARLKSVVADDLPSGY